DRYLLEVLPLTAIAAAWALDARELQWRSVAGGAGLGIGLVLLILIGTPMLGGPDRPLWVARQLGIMKLPLLPAAILGVLWDLNRPDPASCSRLSWALGACLGWGTMLHLGTDVLTSQLVRSENLKRTHTFEAALPDHSAVVGHWGSKDAVVPLLFDKDIV